MYTAPSNVESDVSMSSLGDSEGQRGTSQMKGSISDSIASTGRKWKSTFERAVTHMREQYQGRTTVKRAATLEPRDMYPRMPWHDLQCAVTGTVARDAASHFVQVSPHIALPTHSTVCILYVCMYVCSSAVSLLCGTAQKSAVSCSGHHGFHHQSMHRHTVPLVYLL